jgi:predicted transcriptional regulator
MHIDIDDKTKARLSAVAATRNTSPEELGADLLRHAVKYQAERAEDMERLDNMRENGGIPHDEMKSRILNQVTAKDV